MPACAFGGRICNPEFGVVICLAKSPNAQWVMMPAMLEFSCLAVLIVMGNSTMERIMITAIDSFLITNIRTLFECHETLSDCAAARLDWTKV